MQALVVGPDVLELVQVALELGAPGFELGDLELQGVARVASLLVAAARPAGFVNQLVQGFVDRADQCAAMSTAQNLSELGVQRGLQGAVGVRGIWGKAKDWPWPTQSRLQISSASGAPHRTPG